MFSTLPWVLLLLLMESRIQISQNLPPGPLFYSYHHSYQKLSLAHIQLLMGLYLTLFQIDGSRSTDTFVVDDVELRRAERARPWKLCEICKQKPHLITEKKIKFCHSCYGEAVAAEKVLSRSGMRRDGSHKD